MSAAARESLPGWVALLVATAVAWRTTLRDAALMGDAPGTMGMPLVPFLLMWVPMMAAMMLPAVTPLATLWLRQIGRDQRATVRVARTLVFAAGYLLVWAGAGLLAYALMRPVELGLDAGLYSARAAAATIFLLAGIYQLSPVREACLARCQSPVALLGRTTAGKRALADLRAGALHGAWCIACCWSLMAVLALVGLMNVMAMVGMSVFIFIEKTTRFGVPVGRLAGIVMIATALVLATGAYPGAAAG